MTQTRVEGLLRCNLAEEHYVLSVHVKFFFKFYNYLGGGGVLFSAMLRECIPIPTGICLFIFSYELFLPKNNVFVGPTAVPTGPHCTTINTCTSAPIIEVINLILGWEGPQCHLLSGASYRNRFIILGIKNTIYRCFGHQSHCGSNNGIIIFQ